MAIETLTRGSFEYECEIKRIWLPYSPGDRVGEVCEVKPTVETFEVWADFDAIVRLVCRAAATRRNGKSSQMMDLVKAKHLRR